MQIGMLNAWAHDGFRERDLLPSESCGEVAFYYNLLVK